MSKNYLSLILLLFIIVINTHSQDTSKNGYRIGIHDAIYYDVFQIATNINFTNYPPWEYIRSIQESLTGKYLYIWHKPSTGKELIICIFDCSNLSIIAEKSPGFGGELMWMPNDTLVHIIGCGTYCYSFNFLSEKLESVDFPNISISDIYGGFVFSSDKRYVAFSSMSFDEISIVNTITRKEVKAISVQERYNSFSIEYSQDKALILTTYNSNNEELEDFVIE